ncbi:major facilitator superfamily transporter [Apiospora arundinis]
MSATEPALIPPDADLHSIPVGLPPPGYESNFIDPPSQVWIPQLAIYTTLPVAIFLILLRIYARLRLKNGLFCEDYLCILGGLASCAFCGALLNEVLDEVYGRHLWDIPISSYNEKMVMGDCVITSLYCIAGALIKNSLLLLSRRMFSPSPLAKTMIDLGIILSTIIYTVLFALWVYYAVPHVGETGWFDPVLAVRVAKNSPRIMVALGFGLWGVYSSIGLSVPKLSVHVHNSVSRWILDIYAVLWFSCRGD